MDEFILRGGSTYKWIVVLVEQLAEFRNIFLAVRMSKNPANVAPETLPF